MYYINISYDVSGGPNGRPWGSLDTAIEKLSKQYTGTGTGFGRRDIGFMYKSKAAAERFTKKAKAFARNRKGVKVECWEDND